MIARSAFLTALALSGLTAGAAFAQDATPAAPAAPAATTSAGMPLATGGAVNLTQDAFDIAAQLGVRNHFSVDECEFLTEFEHSGHVIAPVGARPA